MLDFEAVRASLTALLHLPCGWDYGSDGPASMASYTNAMAIVSHLDETRVGGIDVLPGRQGAIVLAAREGEDEFEIVCRSSGLFDVHLCGQAVEQSVVDVTMEQALGALRGNDWLKPTSFVSCTLENILRAWDDTPAKHLAIQATVPVFLFYVPPASKNQVARYARTYESLHRHMSLESRPFTGASDEKNYQMAMC